MRILIAAGVAIAALVTPTVDAQQMIAHGPSSGAGYGYNTGATGSRWGSKVDGHWWGGVNAPGGWHAYRRPYRGWTLPGYWVSPRFYIGDWGTYGLPQPPAGYQWSRYYDDAVLIDDRGGIYDTVGGINWDGYDSYGGGYAAAPAYPTAPYPAQAYAGNDMVYAPPPPPPPSQQGYAYPHRSGGAGGAIAGAVVGGVAGNLIAGRGNRLGGTLIGAGVGGAAGYAIDRSSTHGHHDRVPVAPDYPPAPPAYAQPAPPPMVYAPPPPPPPVAPAPGWSSADGGVTVVTTGSYYGGSTTVVTVQTPPVITTTTTDIYEDRVTYRAPVYHRPVYHPVRKVVRRRVWAPRCGCR